MTTVGGGKSLGLTRLTALTAMLTVLTGGLKVFAHVRIVSKLARLLPNVIDGLMREFPDID